jgi:hypothetical protein
MTALSKLLWLKDGFSQPDRYLGATIKKWHLAGDEIPKHWGHSLEEYVKQAIANVKCKLNKEGKHLCGRFSTPMSSNYRPELDYSPYLEDQASKVLCGTYRYFALDCRTRTDRYNGRCFSPIKLHNATMKGTSLPGFSHFWLLKVKQACNDSFQWITHRMEWIFICQAWLNWFLPWYKGKHTHQCSTTTW